MADGSIFSSDYPFKLIVHLAQRSLLFFPSVLFRTYAQLSRLLYGYKNFLKLVTLFRLWLVQFRTHLLNLFFSSNSLKSAKLFLQKNFFFAENWRTCVPGFWFHLKRQVDKFVAMIFAPTCDIFARTCDIFAQTWDIFARTCDIFAQTCDIFARTCDIFAQRCDIFAQTCDIFADTCDIFARTCDIFAQTCDIFARTCDLFALTNDIA